MVSVISKDGKVLMPCSNAVARLLVSSGKAKHYRKKGGPYRIKLLYETSSYVQPMNLGVDVGSGTAGYAVYNPASGEIVYMSEVACRDDIPGRMSDRATRRRNRRSRKCRYREPRFLNRGNSTREDRLSPTMVSKIHSHEREISLVSGAYPIGRIILEVGSFDTSLMANPQLADPSVRPWGYQQGPNYGFENTRAMVLSRDNHTCQICGGKHRDEKLETHHIVPRSRGGADTADNLIVLCHTCHAALHRGEVSLPKNGRRKGTLRYATQMNTLKTRISARYPEAVRTYGYVTKANRLAMGLEKSHSIDACCIASRGNRFRICCNLFRKRCVPDGDFQQTQGPYSGQRLQTGKIMGFRKYDKVRYMGGIYFIKGRMSSGYAILMDIDGDKVDFSQMPKGKKTPKLSNMKRIQARSTWMVTEEAVTRSSV